MFLILLSFFIFFTRNVYRIYQENKKYEYNIFLNPYYQRSGSFDDTNNYLKKIVDNFNNCNLQQLADCSNTGHIGIKYGGVSIGIKELHGYIFFFRKLF
jgi:hypothetical protein